MLLIGLFYSQDVRSQQSFHGWIASSHQQELGGKWLALSDIQFRSGPDFRFLETILLRPAIGYKVSEKITVASGYAYLGSWEEEDGNKNFEKEHRAWQHVEWEGKAGSALMSQRVRLEQRWLEAKKGYDFAQRLRYLLRFQLPFNKTSDFRRGWYGAGQDEVFVNIQNKNKVNGHSFDQNRTFLSIGYRFSANIDVEAGYLYRYQVEDRRMHHHIAQLMVTTSL